MVSLREYPSSVPDDSVARTSRVSRVAQGKPPGLQATAFGLDQQARHSEGATGAVRTQTGPVAVLDRGSGVGIKPLSDRIRVIVGQIRTDHDQRFRSVPQPA